MSSLKIKGPIKISGTIQPGGNKNAALPIIAASMLTGQTVVIHNMPEISDVSVMLQIAEALGAKVVRDGKTVSITAETIITSTLP